MQVFSFLIPFLAGLVGAFFVTGLYEIGSPILLPLLARLGETAQRLRRRLVIDRRRGSLGVFLITFGAVLAYMSWRTDGPDSSWWSSFLLELSGGLVLFGVVDVFLESGVFKIAGDQTSS